MMWKNYLLVDGPGSASVAGQRPALHPCPSAGQAGLWCAHPVSIMRCFSLPDTSAPVPAMLSPSPHEMNPSPTNVLMESGQMTAPPTVELPTEERENLGPAISGDS